MTRCCRNPIVLSLAFMALTLGDASAREPYGPDVTLKPAAYGIAGSKVQAEFHNHGMAIVKAEVQFDEQVVPSSLGDKHGIVFFNVPSGAAPGWHKVTVTASAPPDSTDRGTMVVYHELKFRVLPSKIQLLNVEPDSGPPGTTITLLADGLDCALPMVRYDVVIFSPSNPLGTQINFSDCTGNTPRVHLPKSLTAGKVFIKIRADFKALILSPHVVFSNSIGFNMVLGPPELSYVEPNQGAKMGSEVTLYGYNFNSPPPLPPLPVSVIVHFGNVKVPATIIGNFALKCKVPIFALDKGKNFSTISIQLSRHMGNEVKYSNIITYPFYASTVRPTPK